LIDAAMLSILIAHSYFLCFDRRQSERSKPYPPLATLQVAALLRAEGHRIHLFDAMLAEGLEEYERCLRSAAPQVMLIYEDSFNFLSKMCLANMRRAACDMIAAAHRSGIRVIAAGSDVTDAPGAYLTAGADVALLGEGLFALTQLVRRLDTQPTVMRDALVDGVPDIASLQDGSVRTIRVPRGVPRAAPDLDLPAWDLVDMDRYRDAWMKAHGYFSLNMAASRGCSFRCAWCAKPIWGNHYLQRAADSVAAEMAYLKSHFKPDHVWFADDIFGWRASWVLSFAQAARAADGLVAFTIQTRADLLTERMAQALREAGCCEAWIGAESGSQRVLDAMDKGTTIAEIVAARARLKHCGVRVGFFIQLGYLHEQLEDILATRELLRTARPDAVGVSVSYPLPGTRFYEQVKEQLGSKTHWRDSGDLEMMFHGTYRSDFYRAVRDLLHQEVALEQPGASGDAVEYHLARQQIEHRWTRLVARANDYLSDPAIPAAS
jgi:anaerobic magnesium-protoporphyrin IX monomethyl ester cyclase